MRNWKMNETSKKVRLGDLLVSNNIITEGQLKIALTYQRAHGGRLGEVLTQLDLITEDKLLAVLRYHLKLPVVDLKKITIPKSVTSLIKKDIAQKYRAIPVKIEESPGKKHLFVAMSNPLDLDAINEIEFVTGYRVQPLLTKESAIHAALLFYYNIDMKGKKKRGDDLSMEGILDESAFDFDEEKIPVREEPRPPEKTKKPEPKEYIKKTYEVAEQARKKPKKLLDESYYTTLKKERIVIRALVNILLRKNYLTEKELLDEVEKVESEF
jgi:hypothetical protein